MIGVTWFGMNLLWWIFWLAVLLAFFAFLRPVPRGQREAPLERLQRRYAAGEISTAEYEERRRLLLRDQPGPPQPA